jgi:hypothetical protein
MFAKSMLAGYIAFNGITLAVLGVRNMSVVRGAPFGDYLIRLGGPALPALADPDSPWQRSPGNIRPSVVLQGLPATHTSYNLGTFPDPTLFRILTFAAPSGAAPLQTDMATVWFSIEFLIA